MPPFARNTSGKPSESNYVSGRGAVWVDPDGDGGYVHLGNMPSLALSLAKQYSDHFSSLSGRRNRDRRLLIESTFDIRGQFEEVNELPGALFVNGTAGDVDNAAVAGFAEHAMVAAVKKGRRYKIRSGATPPVQAFGVRKADVTVKATGATQVVASAGRTLTFAAAGKTVTASTGSFIDDGYKPGRSLVSADTSDNNGTFTIVSVTALVITVAEDLVDEGPLSATATLTSPDATLVEGVDYECLQSEAEILFLQDSTLVHDGDQIKVTLDANAQAAPMRKIEADEAGEITAALKFYGEDGETGEKFLLDVPKVVITGEGDLSLITSAEQLVSVPLTFSAVKKDEATPIATIYPLPKVTT